ncbi:MAG: NAD-binding protein [Methanomassiliicoccales archaeon]|nr:NAD-binding protein [Methanomassiliicoccales archaeon]
MIGGFFGFLITEDYWSRPSDALYLTVMTITTVGFGDIVPVTTEGKVVAMIVAISGIAAGISTLQAIFNVVISRNLRSELGLPERRIRMKNHFIICGYGNVGREVAERLTANKESFVVIEKDQETVQGLVDQGIQVVKGDAEDEGVLIKADIAHAKGLIAAMKDPPNMVTVITARSLNPDLLIISEVEDDKNEGKMRRVGANVTVNCYRMGAQIMVERARRTENDPVCGISINGKKTLSTEHEGTTYHFCSQECMAAFKAHPDRFLQWQKAIEDACGL